MSEFDDLLKKRAVALKYDPEKNGAPVVVASGMGYMAEKITEAAMEAGVPIYEDDSLATLLGQIKLGAAIPTELYQAIVEIYVYFLHFEPEGEGSGRAACFYPGGACQSHGSHKTNQFGQHPGQLKDGAGGEAS